MTDDWKPLPYVRLHPEAGALWSEWHTGLMARLRAGEWEGRHAGRVGKYPGLAARLALVWHLIDWAAGRVSDDEIRLVPALTLARVLDLMDSYVMPMDARVYRAFDRSAAANGGERIARWIDGDAPGQLHAARHPPPRVVGADGAGRHRGGRRVAGGDGLGPRGRPRAASRPPGEPLRREPAHLGGRRCHGTGDSTAGGTIELGGARARTRNTAPPTVKTDETRHR